MTFLWFLNKKIIISAMFLNNKQKNHFVFKKKRALKKHIFKFSLTSFKLKHSICITEKQENLLKFFILKKVKKLSNKKIKLFFYFRKQFSYTKLPLESGMGKGKGEIVSFFGFYKSGFLLIEFKNFYLNDLILLKNYLNKKFSFNFLLSV